jgi:hypothetical protein
MRFARVRWLLAGLLGVLLVLQGTRARAITPTLVEVKKEKDGTYTYVYQITVGKGVTVKGGTKAPAPDFFTIYNFVGLVKDSNKQPKDWKFSTADEGVTPLRGGRALINPIDVKGVPNVTWSYAGKKALVGPAKVKGTFSVRTTVTKSMTGEYGVQVTRTTPAFKAAKGKDAKEARIGFITTPEVPKK